MRIREDLFYSAMVAEAPHYELTSFSLPCNGALGNESFNVPGLDLPYQLYGDLSTIFRGIRYLTFALFTAKGQSHTAMDLLTCSKVRTAVEYHLLSFKQHKEGPETTDLDCHVEIYRLAALIYVQRGLHVFLPAYGIMRSLKVQIMHSFEETERNSGNVVETPRPSLLLWALFMGGILSLDEEDEKWFAHRIARHVRAAGIRHWAQMEGWLREVCWLDKLYTPTCRSLWQRVEDAVAENRPAELYL